jgi:hypothetical protein
MKARFVQVALFLVAAAAPANAASIWPGSYAGDCGKKVQCIVDIDDRGGKFVDFKLTVANRIDFDDVKCKIEAKFTRSSPKGISAQMKGTKLVYVRRLPSGIEIFGIPKSACGLNLDRQYDMFGD